MDTVEFALACYRAPLDYQDQLALTAPLPDEMDRLLWLANGSPDALEAASRQTGAYSQELRDAARFCVQQLCFARGAGHHRLLGVEPDASLERIKEHHRLLMRLFHPDRSAGRETWTDQYAARVNEAWTALSRGLTQPESIHEQPRSWLVAADPPQPHGSRSNRRSKHAFDDSGARLNTPVQWLPALVLGGLALAATLVLSAMYLTTRSSVPTDSMAVAFYPQETATDSSAAPPGPPGAIAAFLATPDWQALEQREQQVRQQVVQTQEARQKLAQSHQEQLAADLRTERTQLERLKAEQARLAQEPADPVKIEQVRQEERLKAERARLERLRLEEHLKIEQTKAERVRLEEQLKAEQARLEQARLERVRLEEQLRAKQVKAARTQTKVTVGRASASVAAPADVELTKQELNDLIGRYTRAYERGDLNGILALFADNARSDRDRIRRDYSAFFAKNDVRQLSLQLRWNPRGASASGAGRYELQAQRRNDGKLQQAGGAIRFSVRKQDGRALIDAIEYD